MHFKMLYRKARRKYRLSLAFIPNLFTYMNACCGFLSVVCAIQEHFIIAAWFIGCALFLDACDGRVARALGLTSFLGAELDGLADVIAFCCAPALLMYLFYREQVTGILMASLLFFLCAGLFRLARFNTQKSSSSNCFSGLPSPVAAIVLAALIMDTESMNGFGYSLHIHSVYLSALVCGLGILMLSKVPFMTCKTNFYSKQTLFLAILVLIGSSSVWFMGCQGFLTFPLGYIVASLGYWLVQMSLKREKR